jgi:hypothetical protein
VRIRFENIRYFSQLLNLHNVSDVRQIEVHTAELLVSGPSRLEVEIAIGLAKNRNRRRALVNSAMNFRFP